MQPFAACDAARLTCPAIKLRTVADEEVIARLNTTAHALPKSPSEVCPFWNTASNVSPGYGNVLAFPSKSMHAQCGKAPAYDTGYNCSSSYSDSDLVYDSNSNSASTTITNFWSTSLVSAYDGQPVASLMLDVSVEDDLGQQVAKGMAEHV